MQKSIYTKVVWHVTPEWNGQSILEQGVDPEKSRGPFNRSWYVTKQGILWAVGHVSLRYDIPVSQVVVCTVSAQSDKFVRFPTPNVYFSREVLKIENVQPAYVYYNVDGEENE